MIQLLFALIVTFLIIGVILIVMLAGTFISIELDPNEGSPWTEPIVSSLIVVGALVFLSVFDIRFLDGAFSLDLNITGVLVPILVSAYIIVHRYKSWKWFLVSTVVVALLAYPLTEIRWGMIVIDLPQWLLPTAAAALIGRYLARDNVMLGASVAYFSGCMGMLIGGDLMHISQFVATGSEIVIGAGGILDFIFLPGVVAAGMVALLGTETTVRSRLAMFAASSRFLRRS
jgi:uncharacterized membrane protein